MIEKNESLKKLCIIVSIVPHGKREIIIDLLESYDVNCSLYFHGEGTKTNDVMEMVGLKDNTRDIILSFIRKEKVKDAILAIEDKFKKFKHNQSIAFSVPMKNIIGMQNYLFLSNLGGEYIGK